VTLVAPFATSVSSWGIPHLITSERRITCAYSREVNAVVRFYTKIVTCLQMLSFMKISLAIIKSLYNYVQADGQTDRRLKLF
jgi:hypothetical protein